MSKSKSTTPKDAGFTADEKAAMKERAKELKLAERMDKDRDAGESAVVEKIAEMSERDRDMATRLHALIKATAPELMPKTWYGMPAYAKEGKIVCFFQAAEKFGARYATLGFSDTAHLDDGDMWPAAFALKALTATEEARISELVKRAVG